MADLEVGAHGLECASEGASGVNHNNTTHANFEEDILKEHSCEGVGLKVVDGDTDDKLGEIAHAR